MIMEQTRSQNHTEGASPQDSPSRLRPVETTAAGDQDSAVAAVAAAAAAAAAAASAAPVATHPEMTSARAHRSHARTTLQPSVQDFNGKIMNRTLVDTDEDQILWMVGASPGRPTLKLHLPRHPQDDPLGQQQQAYPFPATFRWSTTTSPVHLHPSYYYAARLPLAPSSSSVIKSERVSAWTEDVHRRHVARTARARARLSPKPLVVPLPSGPRAGTVLDSVLEPSFSLNVAMTSTTTTTTTTTATRTPTPLTPLTPQSQPPPPPLGDFVVEEEIRCLVKSYQNSPRKDYAAAVAALTSRSRPATTTGRYFDRSNGLRSTKTAPMAWTRPKTAGHWSWTSPGLNIQKVVLRPKEVV